MSITTLSIRNRRQTSIHPYPDNWEWVRPAGWVATPAVGATEQKIVGVYAVYPGGGNFVAFTISGAYTVDWGDGSATEDIASGGTAQHEFDYADLSSSTDWDGYRQAVITITPQAGQNITSLNFSVRNSNASAVVYSNNWLELIIGAPNCTTLTAFSSLTPTTVRNAQLQHIEFVSSAITDWSSKFAYLPRLGRCIIRSTGNTSTYSLMFRECLMLTDVWIDTTTTTSCTASNMFLTCTSLKFAPQIRTKLNIVESMFNGCYSLIEVPWYDTAPATNYNSVFAGCTSLSVVPAWPTAAMLEMNNSFQNTRSLTKFPNWNTANCASATNTFAGTGIKKIDFNTANIKFTSGICTNAGLTEEVGDINGGQLLQGLGSQFNGMATVRKIGNISNVTVTDARNMCQNDIALVEIGNVWLGNVSSAGFLGNIFANCASLASIGCTGMKISFSVANCNLSSTALNNLYSNLASNVTSQTITVTGNYGVTGDDPTIATNKGWTVSG